MNAFQPVEALLGLGSIHPERPRHGRGVELVALDAGGDEQAMVALTELRDPCLNHAAHRLRQVAVELRERTCEHPVTVLLTDHAAVTQITHELDGEERVAFGSRLDRCLQVCGKTMLRKFQRQIVVDVVRRQERKGHLRADAACLQLQFDSQERMIGQQQLGRRRSRAHAPSPTPGCPRGPRSSGRARSPGCSPRSRRRSP